MLSKSRSNLLRYEADIKKLQKTLSETAPEGKVRIIAKDLRAAKRALAEDSPR